MESKKEYQAGLPMKKASEPGSAIMPIKDYARSLEVKERFIDAVGKSQSGIYIQAALLAVANNPKLMECTPQSIFSETLRAATLQLVVDPSIGHAYLVPYKGKASLVIGYRGLYHMAMRTGEYRYINVAKIFEGEFVTEDKISGEITPGGEPTSNKIIGWMASFQLRNGFRKQLYMSVQEIHLHAKKYSPYYSYATSKWQTDPTAMERKTVLRRLISQWGYMDPVDRMALSRSVEEAEDVIDGNLEDMPDPSDVTVEDPYYKDFTEEQHLEELGY